MASAYSVKDEFGSVLKSTGMQRNEPLPLYPHSIVIVHTALLNFRHRLWNFVNISGSVRSIWNLKLFWFPWVSKALKDTRKVPQRSNVCHRAQSSEKGDQDEGSLALHCLVMRDCTMGIFQSGSQRQRAQLFLIASIGLEALEGWQHHLFEKRQEVQPDAQLCHEQWSLNLKIQPQVPPGVLQISKHLLVFWAFSDQSTIPGHPMMQSKSWPQTTQDPVTETGTYQDLQHNRQ